MTDLCFSRNPDNMGITCGKPKGHEEEGDPFHKFVPDDPDTMEWP